jgi:hypothetical protein
MAKAGTGLRRRRNHLDDQADEAWLLSVQRKLYQWSRTSYRDVWKWKAKDTSNFSTPPTAARVLSLTRCITLTIALVQNSGQAILSKILLRSSKSGLIPYLKIPFSDPKDESRFRTGLIKRVVVGMLGLSSERERNNAIFTVRMILQNTKSQ